MTVYKVAGSTKWSEMSHQIFTSYLIIICISDYLFVKCQTASVTAVNVTGFYGYKTVKTFTVVNTNVTWMEALEGCKSLSYGSIPTSNKEGYQFLHLRNHLFLHHEQIIGHPLWLGFLKPNIDGQWYTWGKCSDPLDVAYMNTFSNNDDNQRQCLLLNMTENPREMTHSWYAASCMERHSFVCAQGTGTIEMTEYLGMAIQTWDDLTNEATTKNETLGDCMEICMIQSTCFLFVFISNTNVCQRYYKPLHDLPVVITLVNVNDNNTVSYVKSEENSVHIVDVPETAFTDSYNYTDLPCYEDQEEKAETSTLGQENLATSQSGKDVTTTEKGNQETNTWNADKQIDESIKTIREENTVDVKTLSSYKNKRISAEDKRPSARAFGFIGGLILIFVCTMIVLLDIPKMITDWRKIHRLVKSIANLENTNNM